MENKLKYYNEGYLSKNKVELIKGGKAYFDKILSLILLAKHTIHLQTYIFDNDETGNLIKNALIKAANNQVKIYLIIDGYASQSLNIDFITSLEKNGIDFNFFEPIFKNKYYYFGRRLHHKVLVVDSYYTIIGGINISNRYNDLPNQPAWLDFTIFVTGEIANELNKICFNIWNNIQNKDINIIIDCNNSFIDNNFNETFNTKVRIRRNDWIKRKNEISDSYIEMFKNATSSITIISSYFLPGKVIRRLLLKSVNRGINVDIITTRISDVKIAKHAERWLYDMLLRNKINIYEYQPAILHAKLAYYDDEWLTIGSYNINDISTYASIELNLDVRDVDFVKSVKNIIEYIKKEDCLAITIEKHLSEKNIIVQFGRWISWHIIQVIFYLFTFYYKRSSSTSKKID